MHDIPLDPLSAAHLADAEPARARVETEQHHHGFHLWMAGVFAAIAVAGFVQSYWAKVVAGTFDGAPIFHVHGALFFAWIGFYIIQVAFVASGRTTNHRTWGMAGVALFSVMVCSAVALGIHSIQEAERLGMGDRAREFSIVAFTSLALMAGLFASAIANVRRPETHKRLMLLVMVALLQPAVGRLFALLLAPAGALGPPPLVSTIATGLATDTLILAAMAYDWRVRGRPHSAYVWGGSIILVVQVLRVPIGSSAAWASIAKALQGLMG